MQPFSIKLNGLQESQGGINLLGMHLRWNASKYILRLNKMQNKKPLQLFRQIWQYES